MINVATFNIFWFPSATKSMITRSVEDEKLIEQIIGILSAEVLVFQEILNPQHLSALLARIPGRQYEICVTSPVATPTGGTNAMHLVLACDTANIELVACDILRDPMTERKFGGRRLPVVAQLRHRATGWSFTVVGVHLKSGLPNPSAESSTDADSKRRMEVEHLAEWLSGAGNNEFGKFAQSPTNDVVVLGDFNLCAGNHLLLPLSTEVLKTWGWLKPKVQQSLAPSTPGIQESSEQWSTFLDRVFIDHAIVSPSLAEKVDAGSLKTFAFDLAPTFEACAFRDKQGFCCIPYQGAPNAVVENLYRVSDHRPGCLSLKVP